MMKDINIIANEIYNGVNNGMVIGKGKKNYTLYKFQVVDGWKIYYTFVKILSSSLDKVSDEYPDALLYEGLSNNWHTQASLTHSIMSVVRSLKEAATKEACMITFGKYKGQKVNELTDVDYLCWLVSNIDTKEWMREMAEKRAMELGAIKIGNSLIYLNGSNKFNANTAIVYNAIQNNEPIVYVADKNDGCLWNAYNIALPTIPVGHPYYGMCNCLFVDGKAKKAKGYKIIIFDYEVNGSYIKVNNFAVEHD